MNTDHPFDRMSGKNYKQLDMSPELRKVIVNIAILIAKAVPVSHLALREVIVRSILKTQADTHITFSEAKEQGGVIFKNFYDTLSSNLKNMLRPLVDKKSCVTNEEITRSVSDVENYMTKFKPKRCADLGSIEYETRQEKNSEQ